MNAKIKSLIKAGGFIHMTGKSLDVLKAQHAAYMLNGFPDQFVMRLAEALGIHRMTREQLLAIAGESK